MEGDKEINDFDWSSGHFSLQTIPFHFLVSIKILSLKWEQSYIKFQTPTLIWGSLATVM